MIYEIVEYLATLNYLENLFDNMKTKSR
uniref:Uncharacterized protein n=1 Tax=Arundo donax TaxID=35708 RepID=A0A0A9BQK8_ARUDO